MFAKLADAKKPQNMGLLGALLLLSVNLCFALRSWRGWGDAVIDFPQQLYIAWRISAGDILYRDIQYFYGPFSQLFNGLLFYVFGPGYIVLTMANLAIATVISLVIYRSVWKAFDWGSGLLASLAFVLIHIYQQFNLVSGYNFVAPYSHEATHGTFFLLMIVVVAATTEATGLARRWFFMGFAFGASLLTKPEFILAATLVIGAKITLEFFQDKTAWRSKLGNFLLGASLPVGGSFSYFYFFADFSFVDSFRATLAAINPAPTTVLVSNPLYARTFGIDEYFWQNITQMGMALGKIAAILGIAFAIDLIKTERERNWVGSLFLFSTAGLLLWPPVLYLEFSWPILSTLGLALVCYLGWRKILVGKSLEFSLYLGLAAVAASLKIYLNSSFAVFGFYLLVPGTIFLTVVGFHILPKIQKKPFSQFSYLSWANAVLILCISIKAALNSSWYYDRKLLPLGEGKDRFYSFGYIGEEFTSALVLKEVISRLERLAPKDSSLMVVPEGLLVNYLLRMPNPTPFLQTFIVKTIYDASGGTDYILKKLEERPPDYVLYLRRAPEFIDPIYTIRGPSGFANDPLDWIGNRYSEIDRIGPVSDSFGKLISVLMRKKNL